MKGSESGCYFITVNDGATWLVVGVPVDGGDGWVAGRWSTRAFAVADAERWTELAAAVGT